jgi:hypothetical protein
MKLLLSQTFETYTEESVEQGDAADRGWDFQDSPVTVKEAIEVLRDNATELSQHPVSVNHCAHVWASTTDADQNRAFFEQGESVYHSYFLKHVDGRDLTSRQLFRIYRAAGLAKGRI